MVLSTLHAEGTCRQSEILAFFGETVVGLEALPLLAKPHDHGHLSRSL
jgi:hypothetical protein